MNRQIGPIPVPSTTGHSAAVVAQQLCFWGAVLLPVTYLPILYRTSGGDQLLALFALVAVNVCCLIAGHEYSR